MRRKPVKLSKKETKYRLKMSAQVEERPVERTVVADPKREIRIPHVVSVRRFAELAQIPVPTLIQALFKNGIAVTINESVDFDTAVLIGDDLNLIVLPEEAEEKTAAKEYANLQPRPPIVTIMGHVDHGKTKLLDAIRETNIVASESGGITQHIGAYQAEVEVDKQKRKITFLDTPGHEAFSALRAHGANLTDIVVLVVAADDGIKAQTLEAITHARSASVPIIVAINKIDLPAADIDRVKRELSENDLLPEEWGGKIPVVPISAKDKTNIELLLETIALTADLLELTADPTVPAEGTVIESHIDHGVGPIATVLVQQGTIEVGSYIVIGQTWGKIRFIEDWRGTRIKSATPATPVKVAGLKAVPSFGERFYIVKSEKEAKQASENREQIQIVRSATSATARQEFTVIVRADVMGSLEAIKSAIHDIPQEKITVKIISEGIGAVTESDINLAVTAHAHIFAFRVPSSKITDALAKRSQVQVHSYATIYSLIEELYALIEGQIDPEFVEEIVGTFEVIKNFFEENETQICGGKVKSGTIIPDLKGRVIREGTVIGQVKITQIKVGPTAVTEVKKGEECGLQLFKGAKSQEFKVKAGDIVEAFRTKKIETHLEKPKLTKNN